MQDIILQYYNHAVEVSMLCQSIMLLCAHDHNFFCSMVSLLFFLNFTSVTDFYLA